MLNQDQILDQALELISAVGLRRFSLSELGARLGVVKSALYHHFPGGKSQIVREVFRREEDRVLGAMEEALAQARGAKAKLSALAEAKIRLVRELGRLYRLREEIADELEGFLVSRRREFLQRELRVIARVIQEGVEQGELRPVNSELLALALQGALHNLSRAYAVGDRLFPPGAVEQLIEAVFNGIRSFQQEQKRCGNEPS